MHVIAHFHPFTQFDASVKVYKEIFHGTSSGDFGIEIKDGPILRCHTDILGRTPGFLSKVRQFGKLMHRTVPSDGRGSAQEYFREHNLTKLYEDATFTNFGLPFQQSAMQRSSVSAPRVDTMLPGYSTRTLLSGDSGAVQRRDQFFLAERYELDIDCERLCELLRFMYQGEMSYFKRTPNSDAQRDELTKKMLELTYDAEKYSVDKLFAQLLDWFGNKCYDIVGEANFANAFYSLQHFEFRCTEKHTRDALVETVTGVMLATRDKFRAVTLDPRWMFLPVDFVHNTLSYDGMPIGSEVEVLTLIERWNANVDKSKEDIIKLLCCFRPDDETRDTLEAWMRAMGWISSDGQVVDLPGIAPLIKILKGAQRQKKKPRKNVKLDEYNEDDFSDEAVKQRQQVAESLFVQYAGLTPLKKGTSFDLGAGERLVQASAIHTFGIQRLRVVLSNQDATSANLWDPEHEVFVGVSYGERKYFGYLCSATAFAGIFSLRALAGTAPCPNAPVHITGSGNKVEFDVALEVQLRRVNLVVTCKLSVLFKGDLVTEELFQVSSEALSEDVGLRFQVVGTGLGQDRVNVTLNILGLGKESAEEQIPEGDE